MKRRDRNTINLDTMHFRVVVVSQGELILLTCSKMFSAVAVAVAVVLAVFLTIFLEVQAVECG